MFPRVRLLRVDSSDYLRNVKRSRGEVMEDERKNASYVVTQNGVGADNRHLKAQTVVISVYQTRAGKDARVQRDSVGNQGSDRPSKQGQGDNGDTGIQRLSHRAYLSVGQHETNRPHYFLLETSQQVLDL
jgi:hypothetical protein